MNKSRTRIGGIYICECYDKVGKLKWIERIRNICTDEGLNHILNVEFHAVTQLTTWYLLVFETNTTPTAGTTYAVPVFTECVAYDEANRPEYEEAASISKSITNTANKAKFTFNATKNIYGVSLVAGGSDSNTKGDTAGGGTMFCAGRFSSVRPVEAVDVLYITYQVSSVDDGI